MISRKTAILIADCYRRKFTSSSTDSIYRDELYDFLFERDYEAWFCNLSRTQFKGRGLKDFVMKLHTGESFEASTKGWTWEKRRLLGQTYLRYLAEDFLQFFEQLTDQWDKNRYVEVNQLLRRGLEVDGYIFRDGSLLFTEADVLNIREEQGILHQLYCDLQLADAKIAFECLELSEDHYKEGRWADSISNSRKFLESALQNIAASFSQKYLGYALDPNTYQRPVAVREFLMDQKLLEKKEKEALDKVYGLLSHTGSHPYMAENDQARLLRQLSLTFAQFVMLRYEGRTKLP